MSESKGDGRVATRGACAIDDIEPMGSVAGASDDCIASPLGLVCTVASGSERNDRDDGSPPCVACDGGLDGSKCCDGSEAGSAPRGGRGSGWSTTGVPSELVWSAVQWATGDIEPTGTVASGAKVSW